MSDRLYNFDDLLYEISKVEQELPTSGTEFSEFASFTEPETPASNSLKHNPSQTLTRREEKISTMIDSVKHKFTSWSGSPDQYTLCSMIWRAAIEDEAIVKGFGGERSMCLALMQAIPAEHRDRIGPFFGKLVKSKKFLAASLLDEFDRHFIDRDREARNERLLYAVIQGQAQSFAKFMHTFEGYMSNAGELAPIGASRIHTLSKALAPYLRQAAANQTDLDKLNYEKYVDKLSTLAINWESLPEFQNKHASDRIETYTKDAVGDLPLKTQEQLRIRNRQPQPSSPISATTNFDRDGDIEMSGTGVAAIVASVMAVMGNQRNSTGRPYDKRPQAPWCSQEIRDQRLKAGRCIRCNSSPSHRFRECKYKGFPSEPAAHLASTSANEIKSLLAQAESASR